MPLEIDLSQCLCPWMLTIIIYNVLITICCHCGYCNFISLSCSPIDSFFIFHSQILSSSLSPISSSVFAVSVHYLPQIYLLTNRTMEPFQNIHELPPFFWNLLSNNFYNSPRILSKTTTKSWKWELNWLIFLPSFRQSNKLEYFNYVTIIWIYKGNLNWKMCKYIANIYDFKIHRNTLNLGIINSKTLWVALEIHRKNASQLFGFFSSINTQC